MTNISLAISDCPNDTMMFYEALHTLNKELKFDTEFMDIQRLNEGLKAAKWDVAKTSAAAYPQISNDYEIFTTGSAMGTGNGPLLISSDANLDIKKYSGKILIPGIDTTANALLTHFFPNITNKEEVLFSAIPSAIAAKKAKVGLIIHESRFTYKNLGLYKIADMGELWESEIKKPLPLGIIVVKRKLDKSLKNKIFFSIKSSVAFALQNKNTKEAMEFVMNHSTEKDINVVKKHIELYVNDYSLNMELSGQKAILSLINCNSENDSLNLQNIFFQ